MFQWDEYLRLGRHLSEISCADKDQMAQEAKRRSAISRAYYAAYHIAKNHLQQKYSVVVGKDHGQVWNGLQTRDRTPDEQEAGRHGQRLMDKRRKADYKELGRDPEKETEFALIAATNICALLGRPF